MSKPNNAHKTDEVQVQEVPVTENSNETTGTSEEPITEPVVEQPKVYDVAALMLLHKTKSGVIRYLASEGLKTGEITKVMKTEYPNFIYQHARNVLNQIVKKK